MRKILVLVWVVILFSYAAVTAAAQEGPVIEAGSVTVEPGQSFDIPVALSGNPGLLGGRITVTYSKGLAVTKITQGEALSSLTMTKPGDFSANPFHILWDGVEADYTNGVIAILSFTAPAEPGKYEIVISCSEKDMVNSQLQPVAMTFLHGEVTVGAGEGQGGEPASVPVLSVDSITALPGQSVEVPVRISGNTGLVGARIKVGYTQGLVLTGIEKGEAFSGLTMTKPGDMTANPFYILWDGIEADYSDGVIAVLHFMVPSAPGNYKILLSYTMGDIIDNDLKPVHVEVLSGEITVEFTSPQYADIQLSSHTAEQAEILVSSRKGTQFSALCMTAAYDAAGRMIDVHTSSIHIDAEETISLSVNLMPATHQLKLFLLDPDTLAPYQQEQSFLLVG